MTQEDLNQLAVQENTGAIDDWQEGSDVDRWCADAYERGFKKALELVGKSGIIEDITGYYAHSDNLLKMLDID